MKKRIAILLVLAMVSGLVVACGNEGKPASGKKEEAEGTEEEKGKDYNVAVFTMSASGEFWNTVMNGAKDAGEELGIKYTVNGPDTESSFEQQISMVEDAITKGADAVCIAVCDSEALVPTLETAAEKGIKIVLFNTNCSYEGETFIATDNFLAGQSAGEALAGAAGEEGKYVCLGSAETVEVNRQRIDGCRDYIEKNVPGMEHIDTQYCDNNLEKAMRIVNDWITANPDLKAIFANNDVTTTAVANVLEERGLSGKIACIGFDATETNVVYLEEGIFAGIVTQDAYDIGYQSVKKAVELLEGSTIEKNIATNVAIITKDNLNDEDIRKILNF
jgi:ABC-type sugar transport system, periplasmic component